MIDLIESTLVKLRRRQGGRSFLHYSREEMSSLSPHFQDDTSGGGVRCEKSASPAGDSNKLRSSNASNSGSESPKPARKRFGSIENDLDVSRVNGDAGSSSGGGGGATNEQLEALKQEILREMRKEVNKMKQEIIEGTS